MPSKERKTGCSKARFGMRLTTEERAELREAADLAGLNMSELARRRTLGRPVKSATDLMMIRELRRLGGLLKHTISVSQRDRLIVEKCVTTLKELRSAIERVAAHDH